MPKPFRNQIVGLMRFSYVAKNGFQKSFDSEAETAAFLYDRSRLERRFYWWEKLCLPSLQSQIDPGFTFVVVTGEDMPQWAIDRLREGLDTLEDARLVIFPPKPHYNAMKQALREVKRDGATWRTTFRIDDDDAVDKYYISRLGVVAEDAHHLGGGEPVALAFNRGFYVRQTWEGENEVFDAVERTPLSVGSALVAPMGSGENIYARNHRYLPQYFTTLSDAAVPTYIRAIHRDNDSDPFVHGRSKEMEQAEITQMLAENFAVTLEQLKAL